MKNTTSNTRTLHVFKLHKFYSRKTKIQCLYHARNKPSLYIGEGGKALSHERDTKIPLLSGVMLRTYFAFVKVLVGARSLLTAFVCVSMRGLAWDEALAAQVQNSATSFIQQSQT